MFAQVTIQLVEAKRDFIHLPISVRRAHRLNDSPVFDQGDGRTAGMGQPVTLDVGSITSLAEIFFL